MKKQSKQKKVAEAIGNLKLDEYIDIYAFIVGLLATIGSVYVLKNIFKVPRPSNAYVIETGYAMPSGHASLGFFLAVFLIYYIVKKPGNSFRETIGWIILGAFAIIIAASRVFLNVHTINQVTIGAIIGTAIALLAILYTRRKKI